MRWTVLSIINTNFTWNFMNTNLLVETAVTPGGWLIWSYS
jgi:hypothetical protein